MYGGHVIEDGPVGGVLGGRVRLVRPAGHYTCGAPKDLPAEVA
jgi:hypothetical protein